MLHGGTNRTNLTNFKSKNVLKFHFLIENLANFVYSVPMWTGFYVWQRSYSMDKIAYLRFLNVLVDNYLKFFSELIRKFPPLPPPRQEKSKSCSLRMFPHGSSDFLESGFVELCNDLVMPISSLDRFFK